MMSSFIISVQVDAFELFGSTEEGRFVAIFSSDPFCAALNAGIVKMLEVPRQNKLAFVVSGNRPMHRIALSHLASMLRLNLFTFPNLLLWLDNPLGTPPLIPVPVQFSLDLNPVGQVTDEFSKRDGTSSAINSASRSKR
jgi:hypothetical protein